MKKCSQCTRINPHNRGTKPPDEFNLSLNREKRGNALDSEYPQALKESGPGRAFGSQDHQVITGLESDSQQSPKLHHCSDDDLAISYIELEGFAATSARQDPVAALKINFPRHGIRESRIPQLVFLTDGNPLQILESPNVFRKDSLLLKAMSIEGDLVKGISHKGTQPLLLKPAESCLRHASLGP
jgi:hypothetical protein